MEQGDHVKILLRSFSLLIIAVTSIFLPFVESLVSRTAFYSHVHENQVFNIHKDFRLVGQVIETPITDEFGCGLRCLRNRECQSYNWNGNITCELNDKTWHTRPIDLIPTSGFTYYGKERRGTHSSNPGSSCKDILDSEIPLENGEYWIDPESNRNALKVYCDMTTNGGGWLLIFNIVFDNQKKLSVQKSYRMIDSYQNKHTIIANSALQELRTHLPFTQLRFYCSKQHHGRTFHIATTPNSTGEAVVQYFTDQTTTMPASCGSFVRMENDNSYLAKNCTRWGRAGSRYYTGTWSHQGKIELYDTAAFIKAAHHWKTHPQKTNRWECDDFNPHPAFPSPPSPGDFWKVYVR